MQFLGKQLWHFVIVNKLLKLHEKEKCAEIFSKKLQSLCFQLINFHIIQIHPHSLSTSFISFDKSLFTKLQCILFALKEQKRTKNTETFVENLS